MQVIFQLSGGWIEAHTRALLEHAHPEAPLLALGRQMYDWLDGGERWLEQLLQAAEPPLLVEFQTPANPDALAQAFVQAPWELLATAEGYLAGNVLLRYCPVRRLGSAQETPAPTDLCLGLLFMAATPEGENRLDFEAEESAILDATSQLGLVDLVVEESGNPLRLAERLGDVGPMQVVHLTCHGTSQPAPLLLLEDDTGAPQPTTPVQLLESLQHHLPRLLFVSACESAAPGVLADPLALTLVRAGVPALLGWDGTVYDHEATAFARTLYSTLSQRSTLEEAVGAARRALLSQTGPRPSRDWHRARLWLNRRGGGILVGGRQRRWRRAMDHGHKEFLDKRRQQSPVASREAFVGRRRELQTSLKILRQEQYAGLLLHGLGRLGKSSLAARLAHRRPELAPAVVFGHYDARSIVEAIRDACLGAADILDAARDTLAEHPAALEDVLRQVLQGPCAQAGTGQPILLVLDDVERILEEPRGDRAPWRVQAAYQPVLRAILRAFDLTLGRTDSRLLLTSRYTFTVPDGDRDLAERLYALQVPPMEAASARLQLRRAQDRQATPRVAPAPQDMWQRCLSLAQGNPGLQDLLADLVRAAPQVAKEALDEMEVYLARGDLPRQERVHAFLEDLLLERLLTLAQPGGGRELLRALTVFAVPVPLAVAEQLATVVGGDIQRLRALGLVDRFANLVTPAQPAVAVNALVKPRAGELTTTEQQELTRQSLDTLFACWGGAEGTRPFSADIELTRLALLSPHAPVMVACAADAVAALEQQFAYQQAATWGQQAIAWLDAAGVEAPLGLLRRAGEVCLTVGAVEDTRAFYDRALARLNARQAQGQAVDPFEHGALLLAQARLLAQSGEPAAALPLFEQARAMALQQGSERNAAVTLGDIAHLQTHKGDVDTALALHQEQLEVYERLGEVRARAITLGDIARLRAYKGDVEDALRLQQECLAVNKHLGNLDGQAAALWDIAQIEISRNAWEQAAPRIFEAYQIVDRLGRLDGICVIGVTYG